MGLDPVDCNLDFSNVKISSEGGVANKGCSVLFFLQELLSFVEKGRVYPRGGVGMGLPIMIEESH